MINVLCFLTLFVGIMYYRNVLLDVWCETRGVLSPLLFSVDVNDMIQKLCDEPWMLCW